MNEAEQTQIKPRRGDTQVHTAGVGIFIEPHRVQQFEFVGPEHLDWIILASRADLGEAEQMAQRIARAEGAHYFGQTIIEGED